jgi:hypothetical protein
VIHDTIRIQDSWSRNETNLFGVRIRDHETKRIHVFTNLLYDSRILNKKTLYCPLQFSNKLSDKKINISWQSSTGRKLTWATTFGVRDWILARNRSWARFEASFRSRRSRSSEVSGGNSVRWLSSSLWSF